MEASAGTVVVRSPAPGADDALQAAATVEVVGPDRSLSELASIARREAARGDENIGEALRHYVRAGEALIEAKAKVKHGEWGGWLDENLSGRGRSARDYMQVARACQENPRLLELTSIRQALNASRRLTLGTRPLTSIRQALTYSPPIRRALTFSTGHTPGTRPLYRCADCGASGVELSVLPGARGRERDLYCRGCWSTRWAALAPDERARRTRAVKEADERGRRAVQTDALAFAIQDVAGTLLPMDTIPSYASGLREVLDTLKDKTEGERAPGNERMWERLAEQAAEIAAAAAQLEAYARGEDGERHEPPGG